MPKPAPRLVRAWLDSLSSGIVEFDRDWDSPAPPAIALSGGVEVTQVRRASDQAAAKTYRDYMKAPGVFAFALPLKRGGGVNLETDKVYVAGPFNGWQAAVGNPDWQLKVVDLDGERSFVWSGPADTVIKGGDARFKFVTGENHWLPPADGPFNSVRDDSGNVNRIVDPERTGDTSGTSELGASLDHGGGVDGGSEHGHVGGSQAPGARGFRFFDTRDGPSAWRPRFGKVHDVSDLCPARGGVVNLHACHDLAETGSATVFPLARRGDNHRASGVWEVELDRSLHGWFYWYSIGSIDGASGKFFFTQRGRARPLCGRHRGPRWAPGSCSTRTGSGGAHGGNT